VNVNTIIFVSDSNPPSGGSQGRLFGAAATRTLVFRFADATAAQTAITKAQDGSLATVGVTGASAVVVPAPPASDDDDDDDKKRTIIIAVVVPVVGVAIIAVIAVIVYLKCKGGKKDAAQDEEKAPYGSRKEEEA